MRWLVRIFVAALAAVVLLFGWALAFDEPVQPPEFISVSRALAHVDFSALPPAQTFEARDGAKLVFRHYGEPGKALVILIHGATLKSASMHVLAMELLSRGAEVYSLGMRGHEGSEPFGDSAYPNQLVDDVEDFVKTLPPKAAGTTRAMSGFSAGGNLTGFIAGSAWAKDFDRYVLISPALGPQALSAQHWAPGFFTIAQWRGTALLALNSVGIASFNHLPLVAYGVGDSKPHTFSGNLILGFGGLDALARLKVATGHVELVAGEADEILASKYFDSDIHGVRKDIPVTILPGMKHMDMVVKPEAVKVVADKIIGN